MEDSNRRRVVILLSDKRSGSTMAERELCRHAGIRHVAHSPHSHNETQHWLKGAVVLGLPPSMFSEGNAKAGYGSRSGARTYLIDEIRGNVPNFVAPQDDHELVFDGWEALCERFAQPVFFEKSPQHLANWGALSLMLQWAGKTKFEVKFIGLLRNPMAVMYSAQQLFGTEPATRQFGWVEIQRNLLAFREMLRPEQYLELKYEDLIAEPKEGFGRVCDFIGVERDESIGRDVHTESAEKWRKDAAFGLQLDPLVERMAKQFGYRSEDLDNVHAGSGPRDGRVGPGTLDRTRAHVRNRWVKPLVMKFKQLLGE